MFFVTSFTVPPQNRILTSLGAQSVMLQVATIIWTTSVLTELIYRDHVRFRNNFRKIRWRLTP